MGGRGPCCISLQAPLSMSLHPSPCTLRKDTTYPIIKAILQHSSFSLKKYLKDLSVSGGITLLPVFKGCPDVMVWTPQS